MIDLSGADPKTLSNLWAWLRRVPTRLAVVAQTLQEYTAVFAVEDAKGLEAAIAAQAQHTRLYDSVAGLHNLRFYALEMNEKTGGRVRQKPDLLVMAAVFDGDRDDFLDSLLREAGSAVHEVLLHTRGYRRAVDTRRFIGQRRVRGGYFFHDLGKLEAGPGVDATDESDASVAELDDAIAVQSTFEDFHAANRGAPPAELMKRFAAAFAKHRTTLPAGPSERHVTGEARYTRQLDELTARLQRRVQLKSGASRLLRGAQAKAHGYLRATFTVDPNLDPRFRQGLFAEPGREFRAWLRPANGHQERRADGARDSRALTIRVEVPEGTGTWTEPAPGLPTPEGWGKFQDFLLFSYPSFFAPDVRKFNRLMGMLTTGPELGRVTRLGPYFFFGFFGGTNVPEVLVFFRMFLKTLLHPLAASFHSGSAYRLGADNVVKYSAVARNRKALALFGEGKTSFDFLKDVLKTSLSDAPITVDFYIHVHPGEAGSDAVKTDVENGMSNWSWPSFTFQYGFSRFFRLAHRVKVGTITLPHVGDGADENLDARSQPDPSSERALASAEDQVASPWNALDVHRPLGNLNRARYFVYKNGAERRLARDLAVEARPPVPSRPSHMPAPSGGGPTHDNGMPIGDPVTTPSHEAPSHEAPISNGVPTHR